MTYQKTTRRLQKFPASHTRSMGCKTKQERATFSKVRGKFWVPFHVFQDVFFFLNVFTEP